MHSLYRSNNKIQETITDLVSFFLYYPIQVPFPFSTWLHWLEFWGGVFFFFFLEFLLCVVTQNYILVGEKKSP